MKSRSEESKVKFATKHVVDRPRCTGDSEEGDLKTLEQASRIFLEGDLMVPSEPEEGFNDIMTGGTSLAKPSASLYLNGLSKREVVTGLLAVNRA